MRTKGPPLSGFVPQRDERCAMAMPYSAPEAASVEPLAEPVPTETDGAPHYDLCGIQVTQGSYNSIQPPLAWLDIPKFAILCGVNGSGKTQLLEAIDAYYRRATDIQFSVTGLDLKAHEVLLLRDSSKSANAVSGYTQLSEAVSQARNNTGNPFETAIARLLKEKYQKDNPRFTSPEPLELFYANPQLIERAVAHHFASYVLALADLRIDERGIDFLECRALLGISSWDELNEVLALAAFPYRFVTPLGQSIVRPITLRLQAVGGDTQIGLDSLSSGEATILRFLLFVFAAKRDSFSLKLLLLDEPDAHLHASLIHVFLNLLTELVDRYDIRVIMSTHRTETLALASHHSLFVMRRDHPRVVKSHDRHAAINLLTSNVVGILLADKRPVFVEDIDDVTFYRAALTILSEEGHWERPILPEFVPASTWAAPNRMPGGKGLARKMAATLRDAGASDIVRALIDGDEGNQVKEGVVVLDRYSIENYLLDPLVVYALLLEADRAPVVRIANPVRSGEEGAIRSKSNDELQMICDAVVSFLEPHVQSVNSDAERVAVEYTNGRRIEVPRWLIDHRGHDLVQSLVTAMSSPRARQRELTKAFLKVRLVPTSLRRVLLDAAGLAD